MQKPIRYRKAPRDVQAALTQAEVVTDFLPSPRQLLTKEETATLQLRVSKRTMQFFRQQAKRYRTTTQSVIRRVMDTYAQQFARK